MGIIREIFSELEDISIQTSKISMQKYKRTENMDRNNQEQGNNSKGCNILIVRIPKREGEKEK